MSNFIEYSDGIKAGYERYLSCWLNGYLHKSPIENAYGSKYWYLNGKLHRIDGPAIEWADGGKEWWLNGERHRIDGPAIEWANGYKEWWINGERNKHRNLEDSFEPSCEN